MIMVLTLVGVYSVNNSVFDIWVMLVMGVFGYFARKLKFDLGPLLLAFVLGPIMERSLRQALLMSNGHFGMFFTRPISGRADGRCDPVRALQPAGQRASRRWRLA